MEALRTAVGEREGDGGDGNTDEARSEREMVEMAAKEK